MIAKCFNWRLDCSPCQWTSQWDEREARERSAPGEVGHQDHFAHGRRVRIWHHFRLGWVDGRPGSFHNQEPPPQPALPRVGHLGGRPGPRGSHQVCLQLLGLPDPPVQVQPRILLEQGKVDKKMWVIIQSDGRIIITCSTLNKSLSFRGWLIELGGPT